MEKEEKHELLRNFYEEWANCERCGLCNPRGRERNHVVFGEGNPDAKLVIIGEAPGETEDLDGGPFKGKSGEIVDDMLESFNSTRDEVFIMNMVGCRPTEFDDPNRNRTPTKEEIEACLSRVYRTIEIIDPYVLLLLGKTPLKALTTEKREISKVVQSDPPEHLIARIQGRQLMLEYPALVAFHPSYLLRNWVLEEHSDVHYSFMSWEKAFRLSDSYEQIYTGKIPPLRSKNEPA